MTWGRKPSIVVWILTSAATAGMGTKARHRRYPVRLRTPIAMKPKVIPRFRERAVCLLRFRSVLVRDAMGHLHSHEKARATWPPAKRTYNQARIACGSLPPRSRTPGAGAADCRVG